jgi:glutamate synthase domain-containing protein 3
MKTLSLATSSVREVNALLHAQAHELTESQWRITEPEGCHALACGLDCALDVIIDGHAGYYCAGMNQKATVTVNGTVGVGVAENMMSGTVRVKGDA